MLSIESYLSTVDVGKISSVDGLVSSGFDSFAMFAFGPGLVLLVPYCRGG